MTIHERLIEFLESNSITYNLIDNKESDDVSCKGASRARGMSLKYGAKSLLVKSKHGFHLFTLSASKSANSTKMRSILSSQKLRFATEHELFSLAGVPRGALPPFGKPFYPFDQYLDESLFSLKQIAFNAGILEKSIVMSLDEFLKLTQGERGLFT